MFFIYHTESTDLRSVIRTVSILFLLKAMPLFLGKTHSPGKNLTFTLFHYSLEGMCVGFDQSSVAQKMYS